jgi:hypothetical protein
MIRATLTLLLAGACCFLAAAGCSHGGAPSDQAHRTKADDDPSFVPPSAPLGESPIDRGEDPDGAAAESAQFEDFATQVKAMQDKFKPQNKGVMYRAFHAKAHACIEGELRVLHDRSSYTKFGIFQETDAERANGLGTVFPVWARFSNGLGIRGADANPDARGLAVKVMGIAGFGSKLREDDDVSPTQDILAVSMPSQPAHDAAGFMDFAATQADPVALARWSIANPDLALPLIQRTGQFVYSMLAEQFFTGGANRLGPRAVRYTLAPCSEVTVDPDILRHVAGQVIDGEDSVFSYLRADMKAHLVSGDICYNLGVMFQDPNDDAANPSVTPIEDAAVVWSTPVFWVAQLFIPTQSLDVNAESGCNDLSFSPWHSLEEHRPLGNINRVRKAVYAASAEHRLADAGKTLAPEPTGN